MSAHNWICLATMHLCLLGCLPKQQDETSKVAEMGGIPLTDSIFPYGIDGLRQGVFKLCPEQNFIECGTAVMVSEKGYFLTVQHAVDFGFGYTKEDMDHEKVHNPFPRRYIVSSYDKYQKDPIPPQVFEVEILLATKKMHRGPDLALLRLKNQSNENLARLNNWATPLRFSDKYPEPGERIFIAGFPSPKYNPDVLSEAWKNYEDLYAELYEKNPPKVQFVYPNRELFVSSGLFSVFYTETKRIESGVPLNRGSKWNQDTMEHYLHYDGGVDERPTYGTAAADTAGGMSGGPFLDSEGRVFGLLSYNQIGIHRAEPGGTEDKPTPFSGGPSIDLAKEVLQLGKYPLYSKSTTEHRSEVTEKLKVIQPSLQRSAASTSKYLSKLVDVLKKTGKSRKIFKMNKPGLFSNQIKRDNAHENLVKDHSGTTSCIMNTVPSDNESRKNLRISEVEITVENAETSYLRYKTTDRNSKLILKFFEFNDWSPKFKIHTAKILDDIVHRNPFNDVQYGIRLKGLAPYFFDRDASDFGYYPDGMDNLLSTLLNTLAHQLPPVEKPEDNKSDWFWAIMHCTGR